tara:strand:- start:2654 stop:3142 length:489 start_codon:yes stop_codon:yes gene_type:complete
MNRKIHLYLLLLLVLLIFCLLKDRIEPFINQVIFHPGLSFNSTDTTISIFQNEDKGDGSGIFSICSDDNNWTNKDKKCKDYIKSVNCDDIGDDNRTAKEACKISCNMCNKSNTQLDEELINPKYSMIGESSDDDNIEYNSQEELKILMERLNNLENKLEIIS